MTALSAEKAQKRNEAAQLYTLSEYLALEEHSLTNHEFDNGKRIPMAGGSAEHSLIKASVVMALSIIARQSTKKCLVFNSDIRIWLPALNRALMPDAVIVTGEPEFSIEKPVGLLLNPALIVEVFSKSSESYDRGEKFARYRTLPSLEEYVLVAQDAPRVETFVKKDGQWLIRDVAEGLDAEVELASLGAKIALREPYWNISFPTEKPGKRPKNPKRASP